VLTGFLAALLVLDRLEEVLVAVPEIARPLFLVVMAIGVVAARWVRRQQWAENGEDEDRARGSARILWLSRAAEGALVIAMVASVLGYRQLAALLGDGTVTAALAALAFWVSKQVLDGVVVVALRSRPLNALRLVQRNQNRAIRRARSLITWTLTTFWAVFVLEMFHLRGPAGAALATVLGTPLSLGAVAFTLGDVLILGLSLWGSFLFARAVRAILEDEVLSRLQLARGIPYAISTFTSYAVLVLGILVALAATGVDLSRLTIVVGALGVGVGLGLQEIVKDLVAGAVLLFERPIQLGDVVQMGELTGNVQRIGLRSSTVHTFDGAEVIVPNSSLTSSQIVNWTLSDRARRVDLPVGVAYGTDPARVIALLEGLARRHPDVLEEPPPKALFMQFGESSLDFQLRAWTNRVDQYMGVRSELAIAVAGALAEAGITVPFPQRDLHLHTAEPGALRASAAAAARDDDGGR
jgi:small-conductance mechanosensitive channel